MQYCIKCFTIAFILLVRQSPAYTQLPDYHVKMLTEQQGLHAAEFSSIAKDKNGFLWLASQTKIQRYDGKQSWPFAVSEGAEEIFIDNQDRKWLITRSGIQLYINDYAGFRTIKHSSEKDTNPICLFNAWQGLYLLMSNELRVFNEKSQQFDSSENLGIKISKPIIAANAGHRQYLFFATADSIYSLDLTTKRLKALAVTKRVQLLIALSENRVLVSVSGIKTYYVNFETGFMREVNASEADPTGKNKFIQIYGGVRVKQDLFLLSTTQGLVEFDDCNIRFRTPVFYYRGDKLSNTLSIKYLFRDEDGLIYMTHADGIALYNPLREGINYLRHYTSNNVSLPDIDIRSFTQDKKGNTWIATLNGLASLNMKTGELKTFFAGADPITINYPSLRHLIFQKDLLWVGTGGKGLWLYQTETGKFERPFFENDSIGKHVELTFTSEFIWRMVPLLNGDVFIAGGNYCYVVNGQTLFVSRLSKTVFTGISRSAIQDSSGRIWRGTTNGLNCTDDNFNLLFNIRDSFPDKRVAAFCEWKKNHMLIGTKGVYEVISDGKEIVAFRQAAWMPTNRFVYCMEKDRLGRIWLGTDEGLFCHDPATGKTDRYNSADNVQPFAFNSNGLYMSPGNLLFAGGKIGMNYFDPIRVQRKESKLKPLTASFSIGNNDSAFFMQQQPLKVLFYNRSISVNISAPAYENPFSILYRYKLKENSSDWIENSNSRFVRLNNLPPGSYQFIASVSYDGKQWYDSSDPVAFQILSPWWKQTWFIALCVALVSLVIWQYLKFKKRVATRRSQQKTIDYFAHSGTEHSSAEDILWDIARNCISGLGFEDCVIYLVDEEQQLLIQKAAYGAKSPKNFEIANPIVIPVGSGITGTVAATGKAEIINDTTKDKRYIVDDEVRMSEIAVPIIHNEKVIGVIDSEAKRKNFFTAQHLETLKTIASLCSAKISRGMAISEMKKAEEQMKELNNKMVETKFINLRLQMNPHFLFNSLSSIQHLVVSNQTSEAYKYLSVFSAFLRSLLQYADKTVIKLEEEIKMLDMYVRLEQLGSDKTFEYSIDVDNELEPEDTLIPPLIIQPLIENAIWHGLMHKEGHRKLAVNFKNNGDEYMVCTVDDNGIGRKAASSISKNNLNHFAYQSKSTHLIKERLELLKIKTGKIATYEVEDKISNGEPNGTRIKIIIPFYNIDEV